MTNPLKVEGESTKATEGLGLFHDAAETVSAISQGNWAEGLMNAAGGAMGVAGFLADPLAGLVSAGFGWLIEHVPFLQEPLNWLTGNQQDLDSMSKTWGNISNHLDQVSTDLKQWVRTDSGQWQGEEFRAYETSGTGRADTYASVAQGAQGISVLVNICKTILNVVRGIVRDLISEAVGKLVSICIRWAPAMAAFGAGVAGAIAECVATAVKYANKALGWCKKLSKAFSNATGLFGKLDNVFQGAMNALDKFAKSTKSGVDGFYVANAIKSLPTNADALKHGVSEAKKHLVDGVKDAPAASVPKLAVDFGKEAGKVFDSQSGNLFDSDQKQGG
ncbi:hypothetical protein BBK82_46080 [Lentzea guizhouensis]|uniref:Uncharacterized protein n=1 Tax=Lentzea guizhouensis TaxID=1586287 RepID=A0A1B2HWZ2_9PSEU|nr:hypothetical protein [Lentzea guizhouensis]ANZ42215.1 hypothetical protein BBK82_46080 [Lentzea guizhouensis]